MSINSIIMRSSKTGAKVKCMVYERAVKSDTTSGGFGRATNQMTEEDKTHADYLRLDKKGTFFLNNVKAPSQREI